MGRISLDRASRSSLLNSRRPAGEGRKGGWVGRPALQDRPQPARPAGPARGGVSSNPARWPETVRRPDRRDLAQRARALPALPGVFGEDMERRRGPRRCLLSTRVRVLACALASAVLLPSGSCHWSFHSDPDGCDPKKRPCPPSQQALSGGAPQLPLEAYRILDGTLAPLPGALPWEGWILAEIQGPPPLAQACEPAACRAHRAFARRLIAANPTLFGSRAELQACGASDLGSWAVLALGDASSTVLLDFGGDGSLARIERRGPSAQR
jgi:hypothetical protein